MKEIEVKILEVDFDKISDRLVEMGAKKVFDDEICSIMLDDDKDNIKKRKETLRIRTEGKKNVLTFKTHIKNKDAKVKEETELEFSDFENMKKIFERLGYTQKVRHRKDRISYKIDNVKFEFDKYKDELDHIPRFLEIEGPDIDTIYTWADKLGFKKEDCKKWSIFGVQRYYEKNSPVKD